jgi:predicted transcriptional regulator of viral defense system
MEIFAYNWGMRDLEQYLDNQLMRGRFHFNKEEAQKELKMTPKALGAAATRLTKKGRLVSPWRGFYVIVRPEERISGAPDPVRWIDPLMQYLNLDYRVSLLRAAAFHGSSHQAAMIFQVILPKQLRDFALGRHRLQFIYQKQEAFAATNQPNWLQRMKSDTGYAKVAGVELTLLDSARYFHKIGGINGLGQVVSDLGSKADPRQLAKAAQWYENSYVRRLGFLLEHFRHDRQAKALLPFARKAKSLKPLDPSVKPLSADLPFPAETNSVWMLSLNVAVEIDE